MRAITPTTGEATAARQRRVVALLFCCAAALLLLRLPVASVPGVWIDEAFSLYHARLSLGHIWTDGWRMESSPPLYYATLWAWIRLVGDSEIAARLLSLTLTATASLFVAGAARRLAGSLAGAIAALVWLLPALAFEYSMEIRPYALQQLCVSVALWAFARALVERREGRLTDPAAVARALAPMLVAATASFYVHTTSFAFVGGLVLAAAGYGLLTRAGAGYAKTGVAAGASLAVLCLPQAIAAVGVASSNLAGLAWMPKTFHASTQSTVWRHLALGQIYWSLGASWAAAAAIYAPVAAAAWRIRRHPEIVAVTVFVPIAGTLLMVIAGVMQSVMMPRTALWLWVPFAILVGCAASVLDWRAWRLRVAAAALVVLFAATTLAYLDDRPTQRPWPVAIAELSKRIGPNDRVLMFDPELGCLLDRYAAGVLAKVPRMRLELGPKPRFRGQRLPLECNQVPVAPAAGIARTMTGSDWILTGDDTQRRELDALLRSDPALRVVERFGKGGRMLVNRLSVGDRPPAATDR